MDAEWRVPHFEKMLYDTAQLVPIYADAHRVTGRPRYAQIVRESVGWVLREMQLPGGAFASSLDADSEGREGAFYVFTPDQLEAALGADDGKRIAALLEVTQEGTFEAGASVLRLEAPRDELDAETAALLDESLPALREARDARPRPARDDKRIVSWNALMISALARAGVALGERSWVDEAARAYADLEATATRDGRWMRTAKDGRAHVPAFADDYAGVMVAALDLYDATFDLAWLDRAEATADAFLALFWDEASEGLRISGSDQPSLFAPGRPSVGSAEPGAGAIGAVGLVRLSRLRDRRRYAEFADRILRSTQGYLSRAPRALGYEALAGAWLAEGGCEVAIVGDPDGEDTAALLAEVRSRYLPFTVVACVAPDAPEARAKLPWLEGKDALGGRATAYLCEGHTCQLPTPDPATLGAQLEERMIRAMPIAQNVASRVRAPELPDAKEAWIGTDAPIRLADLRGSIVILDFWTHCCINCLHVLPELAAIEERYADQPVVVIGVHCAKFPAEEIAENVRRAMARHDIRHPVLHDPAHAIWEEYAVRSWPTVVVIDPEGRIAMHQSGETTRDELAQVIEAPARRGRGRGQRRREHRKKRRGRRRR